MLENSAYTIGWLSPVAIELSTATLVFDKIHDGAYQSDLNDPNTYTRGEVGRHNVVLTTLPPQYSLESAASTTSHMRRTFTNLRIFLLVGIAGGAPLMEPGKLPTQDIRLGDIVISWPHKSHGGVFQHDLGKAIQNRGFDRQGHFNQPPAFILNPVQQLRASHIKAQSNHIDEEVSAMLDKHPHLRKDFGGPSAASDILWVSDHSHKEEECTCARDFYRPDRVVVRPPRGSGKALTIHYGLVGSGNSLMRDAEKRDRISRAHGVLCFETEAAGIANQHSYLVIRGICDYSDSHKNKVWQGYAALAAAVYARQLLNVLLPEPTNHGHDPKEIGKWLAAQDLSSKHNDACDLRFDGTCEWIQYDRSYQSWKQIQSQLLWVHGIPGCGRTVLAAAIIEHTNADAKAKGAEGRPVLYYYFDSRSSRPQKLENVLRTLIHQFCNRPYPPHWKSTERLYDDCEAGKSQPRTSALKECLATMCKAQVPMIIIDALDECCAEKGTRLKIIKWIVEFAKCSWAQIVVTSRYEYEIMTSLRAVAPQGAIIELPSDHIQPDLQRFVTSRVFDETGDFAKWNRCPDRQSCVTDCKERETCHDMKSLIVEEVCAHANGMFFLASCQLDEVKQCMSKRELLQTFPTLPKDLNEAFDKILSKIPAGQRQSAIRLLQFLLHSKRPLTVEEMADALKVQPDESTTFDLENRSTNPGAIASLCRGMTRIVRYPAPSLGPKDPAHGRCIEEIQLAHASVKAYLQSGSVDESLGQHLTEVRASADIVRISLAYLRATCEIQVPESRDRGMQVDQRFPFQSYAAQYWIEHGPQAEKADPSTLDAIHDMFATRAAWERWRSAPDSCLKDPWDQFNAIYLASSAGLHRTTERLLNELMSDPNARTKPLLSQRAPPEKKSSPVPKFSTILQLASFVGSEIFTASLLDQGADVNAYGGVFGSALQAALHGGHASIARSLIAKGADVNAASGTEGPALCICIAQGDEDLTKLLLSRGADVNAQSIKHGSPLHAAAASGAISILQMLICHGALIRTNIKGHGTPLHVAAGGGHTSIVEVLLAHGASVDAENEAHRTALDSAATGGHAATVRLLLTKGFSSSGCGQDHTASALKIASELGHELVVKVLLEAAGLSHENDRAGVNGALLTACEEGHDRIVKQLLDYGAEINTAQGFYGTALHAASYRNHESTVRVLLAKGASIDALGGQVRGTALITAASNGSFEIVKALLEGGADLNLRAKGALDGAVAAAKQRPLMTPLEAASQCGHAEVVALLLTYGAHVNVNDETGDIIPALRRASTEGFEEVVRLLLTHGADVNARSGKQSITALIAAAANGNYEVVQELLKHGAEVDALGGHLMTTALVYACCSGHVVVTEALLAHGADFNVQGYFNDESFTALEAACEAERADIVRLLLKAGAEVNSTAAGGSLVLQAASDAGHETICEILIDHGAEWPAQDLLLSNGSSASVATEDSASAADMSDTARDFSDDALCFDARRPGRLVDCSDDDL